VSGAGTARLLRFRIGPTAAALPLSIVREVLPRPDLVRVPGGRAGLAGVALARGMALPVYDLSRLRDWPPAPADAGAGGHVIVCDWGEVSVGVLGGAPDLIDAAPGARAPAGGTPAAAYAAGVVERDGEVVTVLDAARVFASLGVPEDGSPDAGEGEGEDDPAGR
jgi:chemotaxis signal transduction protein